MRHRQRHLHKTVVEYLRTELTALDWDTGLFGTPGITLIDYEPIEAGVTPVYNTVAVSIGDQLADREWELGGLLVTGYALFIDVYPSSEPVGIALADDIKDLLTNVAIPLKDFTSDADGVETSFQIEFEDVLVEVLTSAATTLDKRLWRSVKSIAHLYWM